MAGIRVLGEWADPIAASRHRRGRLQQEQEQGSREKEYCSGRRPLGARHRRRPRQRVCWE